MEKREIRLEDVFWFVVSKWLVLLVAGILSSVIVGGLLLLTGGTKTVEKKNIPEERRELLDAYATVLDGVRSEVIELGDSTSIEEDKDYQIATGLLDYELKLRSILDDSDEYSYVMNKAEAIHEGREYNPYEEVEVQRMSPTKTLASTFVIGFVVTIAILCMYYGKFNPFTYSDNYGWRTFFATGGERNKPSFLNEIRLKEESIFKVDDIASMIFAEVISNGGNEVCLLGDNATELFDVMGDKLKSAMNNNTVEISCYSSLDSNNIVDFYRADYVIIVQKFGDKISENYCKELLNNKLNINRTVFAIEIL